MYPPSPPPSVPPLAVAEANQHSLAQWARWLFPLAAAQVACLVCWLQARRSKRAQTHARKTTRKPPIKGARQFQHMDTVSADHDGDNDDAVELANSAPRYKWGRSHGTKLTRVRDIEQADLHGTGDDPPMAPAPSATTVKASWEEAYVI